jgi:dipeptidyl aminopeptidase/acylaminoacyl peptidase
MRNDIDGPVTWLFGGTIAEKRDLMRLASPITHVSQNAPPFLIAHGTLDETVPFEQAERLHEALVDVGVKAELHPIVGAYHNWMTQAESEIPGREDTWKLGPLALPFLHDHLW